MKALHKLFFETKMTWCRVILFAVATAVFTAAMLIIPIFSDTSFENIGISYEAWILFALIIIMNCEKPLEAGLKTIVFFLISQPLIYLLQVPFSSAGWDLFGYYRFWFILTLLTLPGGMIAWFVKKDNILSALILSVATGFLGLHFVEFLKPCMDDFPKYILSLIFIVAEIIVFILVLLKNKKGRILTAVITVLVTAVLLALAFLPNAGAKPFREYYPLESGHEWEICAQNGYLGEAAVNKNVDDSIMICADKYGSETIILTNELGETLVLEVMYSKAEGMTVTEK